MTRETVLTAGVFTAAVATLVALLACEAASRLFHLAPDVLPIGLGSGDTPYRRAENPVLGYELKPSYEPAGWETTAGVRTNAHGQRDVERNLAKPTGVRRVLLLGDSVVEGLWLNDEETMSRQLEQVFSDGRVEVLNFGVSGYCTRSEVEALRTKGLSFDPDVVVLLFVENDFRNFNPEAFHLATERPALANALFRHSILFRTAALRLDLFGFATEQDPQRRNRTAIGEDNVVTGLTLLASLSQEHRFAVLVAIWPSFLDDSIVDLHPMPGPDETLIVERLARSVGLPTVRLAPFFRTHRANHPEVTNPRVAYTSGDRLHPSALGARLAAEALHDVLMRQPPAARPVDPARASQPDAEAIEAARSLANGHRPTYDRLKINLGARAAAAGRLDEAEALYRDALRENPRSPDAHHNLGALLEARGRLDDAAIAYERAIEASDLHAASRYNLALLRARSGRDEDAIALLREAIDISPDFVDAHLSLGLLHRARGAIPDAREAFEQVLALAPNDPRAHEYLDSLAPAPSAH